MSTVKQKRKDVKAIESLEKKINPVPIKKDDPFF